MKQKLIIVIILLIGISCDDNDNTINPNKEPVIKKSNFFEVPSGTTWKMQRESGDTAYFIARDTLENVRFAPVFWDTSAVNCINLKTIPIEFVYWEGKMKKREYYALGITDTGFVFGTMNNPMIDKNYILENFYSVLFFIPYNEKNIKPSEIISDSLQYGYNKYYVETKVTWNNIGENQFNVNYKSIREDVDPYKFSEIFTFEKNIGFSEFREYKLLKKEDN